jgi:hypothetical protein|tara:strand:- start:1059 stop:2030 length:972 start_codon:yes stop_codon:yes gene_type:complete
VIGIFKNNLFINSLLLLPYIIILRVKSLITPVGYTVGTEDTFLVKGLFDWVSSPLLQSILAIILVYVQCIYINRLVIKHRLAPQITLVPGLIFALLVSLMPEFTTLSPHLIANSLILIVIGQVFKIYKAPKVADNIFNVGFWIGIACLFVPNYIYLIIIGLFSVFIVRSVKQKELVQLFSGLGTLFFLVFSGLYIYDIPILNVASKMNFSPHLSIFSIRGAEIYKFAGWLLLAVFSVINYNTYSFKKSIQAKKKIDILFWFLLGAGVLLFLVSEVVAFNALLICIPLAIFLNVHLLNIKNPLTQELIHVVFLILLFSLNFGLI